MSEGPRLPLINADAVAAALFERWKLDPARCFVVGSVRRRLETVGDIEIVAPAMPKACDTICQAIEATMPPPASGLFAAAPLTDDMVIGRAVRGLKAGFLCASLVVRPFPGDPALDVEIPVQVYRYEPANLGWMMIERTGPKDYGKWWLWMWKRAWGIPVGDENHPASIDNHLVNARRERVDVASEAEAFNKCQIAYCEPHDRDRFIARQNELAASRRVVSASQE